MTLPKNRMTLFEIEVFITPDQEVGMYAGIGIPIEDMGPKLKEMLDATCLLLAQKINEASTNGFRETSGPGIQGDLKVFIKEVGLEREQDGKTWH